MPVPIEFSTPGTNHKVAVSTTTNRNSADIRGRKVMIQATADCFIKFGDATVTATLNDIPIFAGSAYHFDTGGNIMVAGITAAGSGDLHITEMI